jgi:tetratricopeptide (TPR) repeat protein
MSLKTEKDLPATSIETWKRALGAVNANNTGYAIALLQSLLKAEPAFLEGRRRLRVLEVQKFKTQSGLSKQMVGVKTGPTLLKAGSTLKKNPAEAMVLAEEALEDDPYSNKGNEILAQAAEALHLPEIAALAYETMCEGNPNNKEPFRTLAELYTKQEEWSKASHAYERLLQIDPRDGDAISAQKNMTAKIASLAGNWEKGQDFRASLKDSAGSSQLEQANKVVKSDEAIRIQIKLLSEKVTAEPANLNWPKQIAALYAQIEELPSAIDWYKYAFATGGKIDNALERTISELELKKLDQEIESYRTAAETDPAQYKEYYDSLLLQRKQVALETAQQRVAQNPTEAQLHYDLGKAHVEMGHYKEALQPLQQGLKGPAVRLEAMNLMGICYWRRQMLDLAEKRFAEAAAEIPGMTEVKKEILYNLGCVLDESGKKEEAVNRFKEIYEMDMGFKDVAARVESSYGG